jgi:hypothetical protein
VQGQGRAGVFYCGIYADSIRNIPGRETVVCMDSDI